MKGAFAFRVSLSQEHATTSAWQVASRLGAGWARLRSPDLVRVQAAQPSPLPCATVATAHTKGQVPTQGRAGDGIVQLHCPLRRYDCKCGDSRGHDMTWKTAKITLDMSKRRSYSNDACLPSHSRANVR
eukprot:1158307-Pelagomonas_calceolata.AAC.3